MVLSIFSVSHFLPSFLLVDRLYHSYVIAMLLQSFSNNKSLFQSRYSEFHESTYNSSLHVELPHFVTFHKANYPPCTSCEVNSSLNSLLKIMPFFLSRGSVISAPFLLYVNYKNKAHSPFHIQIVHQLSFLKAFI